MKIFKLLLPILLILCLTVPCHAAHLPEPNMIDRELTVEKDSNIVKDMIDADRGKGAEKAEVIRMSVPVYLLRTVLPFLTLFFIGLFIFYTEHLIKDEKAENR